MFLAIWSWGRGSKLQQKKKYGQKLLEVTDKFFSKHSYRNTPYILVAICILLRVDLYWKLGYYFFLPTFDGEPLQRTSCTIIPAGRGPCMTGSILEHYHCPDDISHWFHYHIWYFYISSRLFKWNLSVVLSGFMSLPISGI